MKTKEIIITGIICVFVLIIYFFTNNTISTNKVNKIYKVYLNKEYIGAINDKDKLYSLIDEKQKEIKDKYNVSNVYPPNGLQVVLAYTYDNKLNSLDEIYEKIENAKTFTVLGYEIKISSSDDKFFTVNVLDKEVFNEALKKFILAFIDEDSYNAYMNGTQGTLEDKKIIYEDMSIIEKILVKEKYISTEEKIYENSDELAQDLLFGFNNKEKKYTVKEGDTIESVSEDHTLNTQEFLIANPKFSSKDSLLTVGETVNVTLINPELSFSYQVSEIKEVTVNYNTIINRDSTKASNYSEIKTPGVKGLSLQTSHYSVVNGEPNNDVKLEEQIIRPKVDEVVVKGRKEYTYGSETYNNSLSDWWWPTAQPYRINSRFEYRWGRHHNGIDISGPGFGSKIFAANDGKVVKVNTSCADIGSYPNSCGGSFGNYIFIDHGNNVFTIYAHLTKGIKVSEGQTVSRGQVIGFMGSSGQSTGTHLHFGYTIGYPGAGNYRNPLELFPR